VRYKNNKNKMRKDLFTMLTFFNAFIMHRILGRQMSISGKNSAKLLYCRFLQ
jgi:hypothetical protein